MERAVWLGDGVSGCLINWRSVRLCHTRSGKVQNITGWHNLGEPWISHHLPFQAAFCAHHPRQPANINNTSRVYGFATHAVSHTTALFRLPNHHNCLMLPPSPLRPAERSIFFSGKSVRLFDDAHSAASSHAPKKGCGVREVCEADLHVGVAFLLLPFLWRSKEKEVPRRHETHG